MSAFVKGFILEDGTTILEGDDMRIVTVQATVFEGALVKAAKKKVEMQIEGEVETRLFSLDSITEMEKI